MEMSIPCSVCTEISENGDLWPHSANFIIYKGDGDLSLQVIIGLCKHKEAAALKIEPPLQNGRADMSAIRRLFSLPSSGRSFHIYETWCLANTRREIPAPTPHDEAD